MNLPKIHSITKKILVALVGGFLLIFLLFHATANLFVLRHDDGAWYSAFCHFMGSNYIVKVVEIILLCIFALHILLTLWLVFTNSLARPQRYHHKPETKTHTTSRLMMITGILIFAFLVMHFCQFYFVKIGWVKGEYMVETEKLQDEETMGIARLCQSYNMTPEDFIAELEAERAGIEEEGNEETDNWLANMKDKVQVLNIIQRAYTEGNITEDGKWIRHISYEERQTIKRLMPESKPEPDFYFMVRELFKNPVMVILYLVVFVALYMHMRHAFPSAFQTLGLNNYKYNKAIEVIGAAYAIIVCLMFAVVPILVYLGM